MQTLTRSRSARRAVRAPAPKLRHGILRPRAKAGARALLVLLFTGAVMLIGVSTADAHIGSISIDCEAVSFAFTRFPADPATINYEIQLDGTTTVHGAFSITGPSATQVIANHVAGPHVVSAHASWSVDHGGSASRSVTLACASPPPPPPPRHRHRHRPPPPPPPPSVVPAPAVAPSTALTAAPAATPDSTKDERPPVSRWWTSAPPAPQITCQENRKLVNGSCVGAARPAASPKKRHVGVLGKRKTKNLPFTL